MAIIVAAAMALPAVAGASPEIGETSGGSFAKLATGVAIRGTNVGEMVMTDINGNSLMRCTTAQIDGALNRNSGTEIEVTFESTSSSGTGTGGSCTGFFGSVATWTSAPVGGSGTPYCLKAGGKLAVDTFQMRGNSCANASRSITFVLD